MSYRFLFEYASFKVKQIKAQEFINPGIRLEMLKRIDATISAAKRGVITLDETMRLLSMDCCAEGEDMSPYAIDGWTIPTIPA